MSSQHVTRVAAPVRQQVYELLFEAIATSELRPGERLLERDLCERYQVSRTPIREALRALEGEGLVSTIPNHGPVVASVTPEEAANVYQVRAALEGLAGASFAVKATKAQRDRLGRALQGLERATQSGGLAKILQAKAVLYDVLLEGAGNPTLRQQLRALQTRITFLRSKSLQAPGRPAQSLEEIREIVRCVEARNPNATWQACATHIENAATTALGAIGAEARLPYTGGAPDVALTFIPLPKD